MEPHGRELRRMGAHGGAWMCTKAKGHADAVAGAGWLQRGDGEIELE